MRLLSCNAPVHPARQELGFIARSSKIDPRGDSPIGPFCDIEGLLCDIECGVPDKGKLGSGDERSWSQTYRVAGEMDHRVLVKRARITPASQFAPLNSTESNDKIQRGHTVSTSSPPLNDGSPPAGAGEVGLSQSAVQSPIATKTVIAVNPPSPSGMAK